MRDRACVGSAAVWRGDGSGGYRRNALLSRKKGTIYGNWWVLNQRSPGHRVKFDLLEYIIAVLASVNKYR